MKKKPRVYLDPRLEVRPDPLAFLPSLLVLAVLLWGLFRVFSG